MIRTIGFVVLLATVLAIPLTAAAQVSVNINVGPPPVIFSKPPRVVLVPQTPVYYAPDTSYNVFFYDGRYYSFNDGAWFVAVSHGGPWAFVPVDHVPRPVLGVPVRYYKVPPGHAKHHGEDRGHGHDKGCPPGQAKKGRC
jgi:hypothetical protein